MRKKRLFHDGWRFVKTPLSHLSSEAALCERPSGDAKWEDVELPHDWLIYNTADLYETGEGWYAKTFSVEPGKGEKVAIRFEGVYMDAAVYLNERVVGEWKYGYSTFEFDVTPYLALGENELMVRVVYQSPNSRWYTGAGIYRNVWLVTTGLCRVVPDGVYISTKRVGEDWEVIASTQAVWEGTGGEATLFQEIRDVEGNVLATCEQMVELEGRERTTVQRMKVAKPNLWDVDGPHLYWLKTRLQVEGEVVDELEERFGFRETHFDAQTGFYLNGRNRKLNGACLHHDLGSLGAAMNRAALERQLALMKEMGVNAIRTAHNMPAVELMELADEMGLLVVSESFDVWERRKTEYDYARFFRDWHERDVASWVRRDRNHPSVILWSIGNEIYDTHMGVRGKELAVRLRELVRLHDPNGNAQVTFGSNYLPWENTQDCAHEIPVVGYNYAEYLYEEHHKKYPGWVIYGSETASVVQSRGVYHFPLGHSLLSDEDEQCSSLGNSATSWGAKNTAKCITDDRDAKYSLGQFIWSGIDYIGEPTPYFTKNSYFGQVDTAGFPKDSYYQFQAEWTDYRLKPMIHLLPYWDFNPGQIIDVRAYSNAPSMELFLNGKSLGTREIDHEKGLQLSGDWRIAYQPGVLRAVAYDGEGKVVATDEKRSFGDAVEIALEADKGVLRADGRDTAFVTISMKDGDGNCVENANNRVFVKVEGAGRLVGLDNGNSADTEPYKGCSRRLFSGKLLAVVASRYEEGEVRLRVSSRGMKEETLLLQAVPAKKEEGAATCLLENADDAGAFDDAEVPVRKVELTNHGTGVLNQEAKQTRVTARILPEGASYPELEWKLTNHAGIDSQIAELEVLEEKQVRITALGDGEFRLRCFARNRSKRVEVISELEFTVEGLGEAHVNPYRFIAGGLYQASNVELTNGNERGVATIRDGVSHVGFKDLDFGSFGSDEFVMPIFHMSDAPLQFEVWEGMPDEEGSEKLLDAEYHHPTKWNTYQEERFHLPRRLKGVTTLCFVFGLKVHVKGFQFVRKSKAYGTLQAIERSKISGDAFRITGDAIEGIGNNVSIEFDEMEFDKGVKKIVLCGRSHNEVDTIHVRFKGEEGEEKQLVEFPYSDDYVTKEFPMENVSGKRTVRFVFLPGCRFDFKWFRFCV